MDSVLDRIPETIAAASPWEVAAVLLALAYLVLVIRQNIWCWAGAIASTLIYLFLMYRAGLYMESALQAFYIAIAVYGWQQWRSGGPDHSRLPVSVWTPVKHFVTAAAILLLSVASGFLLDRYTSAALPYLDSFTTWAAIIATWMVARKILENWIYWFVIDSVSMYLYISRELYLTAGLFAVYLVLIVFGYQAWRKDWSNGLKEAPA